MPDYNEKSVPRPVMLVILDGWGWREDAQDNAVRQARTPTFTRLWKECPHAFLQASGEDVGLPDGQFGNSEVGHLNIGAGRVVMQDLPRIDRAVRENTLGEQPALHDFIVKMKASGGVCHLMGLVSPGGVHAHQDHAVALAKLLTQAGLGVAIHVFTDGRDTPPTQGRGDLRRFMAQLPSGAFVATVSGRYYAMDRDHRWERVGRARDAIADAKAARFAHADDVMAHAAEHGVTDEFIEPAVVGDYAGMRDNDGILSFNFRSDRIREILEALIDPAQTGLADRRGLHFAAVAGMTHYSDDLARKIGVIFPPQSLPHVLGQVVSDAGKRQLHMAETEKYPHVTYFLNGGEESPYQGEDRILVPSPKVATYDLQPEMSAPELTDRAVEAIRSGTYDLIVLNYANPDMVGHTGKLEAAVRAVETCDTGLGRIAQAIHDMGGALLVIADHGNCEVMRDPTTGQPHTAHTTNPVPVILMDGGTKLADGRLADVAPTLLALMGVQKPVEMTGLSLIGHDAVAIPA